MRYALIFSLTSILVFSSLFAPASKKVGGKSSKGGQILANKSPCFEEDVYACRASGGTFNWSHCTCE